MVGRRRNPTNRDRTDNFTKNFGGLEDETWDPPKFSFSHSSNLMFTMMENSYI